MKSFIIFLVLLNFTYESLQVNHPSPYALSPVYLKYLEGIEADFYSKVKQAECLDRQIFSRYILDYEDSFKHSNQSFKANVAGNPILSMQMINRFVKYFRNESFTLAAKGLVQLEKDAIPNAKEIDNAMDALLRLQSIYDLDSNNLADGILNGLHTNARLSTIECFELGLFARESGYYTLSLEWYSTALLKLKSDLKNGIDSGLKPQMILRRMEEVIKEHDEEYEDNLEEGELHIFTSPINSRNYSEIAHLTFKRKIKDELAGLVLEDSDPKFYSAIEANMMTLCEGKSLKNESEKIGLKCYLDRKRHPYWQINPLKIEMLNENPEIIQLYDVFSNKWISYLKGLSTNELERAPQPPEAIPRTAAYAWFDDDQIPDAQVSKINEFITGLNVIGEESAESLQIAAYAFGAHVAPHFDSGKPDDPEANRSRGDRVTTLLVYLNEVENGGFTAFPMLGFYIKPVKNSAVLWYTNLKNGEVDTRTLHAACPVITGEKWIATKWTHINSNVMKRPCGLDPLE